MPDTSPLTKWKLDFLEKIHWPMDRWELPTLGEIMEKRIQEKRLLIKALVETIKDYKNNEIQ